MIIPATELKSLLKRVSAVKNENLILMDGGIVATDSDLTLCASSESFSGLGTIQVNFRKFSSVVNRLSGSVELTKTDNTLTIKSAKAKVEMEYSIPKPRSFTAPAGLKTIPLGPTKDLLKYVSIAADNNKAAMMGGVVQLETITSGLFEDEKVSGIEAMGTDGKRCAYSGFDTDGVDPFKYMIPLPTVVAIQNLEGETVQIGETDSFYYFKSNQATVYANKLNKPSPDYRSFLPKKFDFTATVDATEMNRVLNVVEPMIQDIEQFAVNVHFLDGRLAISTVGKGGQAEDELEYVADPLADLTEFKIKLNHKFLTDYFKSVSGEVTFNGNAHTKPVILEAGPKKIMIAPIAGGSK